MILGSSVVGKGPEMSLNIFIRMPTIFDKLYIQAFAPYNFHEM